MESIGFTCTRKLFYCKFSRLRLFIPKKQVKSKKKIRLSRGVAGVAVRALVEIFVDDISAYHTNHTDLKF
jgi:hypothetical protein